MVLLQVMTQDATEEIIMVVCKYTLSYYILYRLSVVCPELMLSFPKYTLPIVPTVPTIYVFTISVIGTARIGSRYKYR